MSTMETLMRLFNIKSAETKCIRDKKYLTERLETLSNELSKCIGPIEITEEYETKINPYSIIKGYDLVVADREYVTYSICNWMAILTRLHKNLVSEYNYLKDIWDCDDCAILYSTILAFSAYKAGLSNQPAFAIAWSDTHAFNLFVDSNNRIWIYEPQVDVVIGELGIYKAALYNVKRIWFMI